MTTFAIRLRKLWGKILVLSTLTTIFLMIKMDTTVTENRPQSVPIEYHRLTEPPSRFSPDRQKQLKELREKLLKLPRKNDSVFNFNVSHSDVTLIDRNVTDTRPDVCRIMTYSLNRNRKASIVIPFYNEALSMILRTVHSILNKTPADLLAEVVLVDDHSTYDNLQEPLQQYMQYLSPKIMVIRNGKREGLIRNRMIGAEYTTGDVILFLDAHTEVNVEWLEPILSYLEVHPRAFVQPTIDWITADTIHYRDTGIPVRGAFGWDMKYMWIDIPQQEFNRRTSSADPIRTATLMGCAIAANRDYFYQIGGFDRGLNVWGGENIELSFRAWQCGGHVVILPCSRLGHLYKPFSYSFDGNRELIVAKNNLRVAETWMDDFRKFYYAAVKPFAWKQATLTRHEVVSLNEHKMLREKLKCKDFKWYLTNIIPELNIPTVDALYFGRVTNLASGLCWDVADDNYVVMRDFCHEHRIHPEDDFTLTLSGELKYHDKCVVLSEHATLLLGECGNAEASWSLAEYDVAVGRLTVTIQREDSALVFCAEQVTNIVGPHTGEQMTQLANCNHENKFQTWFFMYKFDFT